MLPYQLYQFTTSKDASGGRLETVTPPFSVTTAAATTLTSSTFRVPLDRVLALRNVSGGATAAAGQNALFVRIFIVDGSGNTLHTIGFERQAAGVNLEIDRQCNLWVPPGFGVRAIATFDAGALANFLSVSAAGVLFPRGNVQLGTLEVV